MGNDLILWATLSGPCIAVFVSIWVNQRNKIYENRENIFQKLVTSRGMAHDPTYNWVISVIPVYFARSRGVMQAHRKYVKFANDLNGQEYLSDVLSEGFWQRQNCLVDEMCKALGHRDLSSKDMIFYQSKANRNVQNLHYRALDAVTHLPKIIDALNASNEITKQFLPSVNAK